jgi:hypothetical protein
MEYLGGSCVSYDYHYPYIETPSPDEMLGLRGQRIGFPQKGGEPPYPAEALLVSIPFWVIKKNLFLHFFFFHLCRQSTCCLPPIVVCLQKTVKFGICLCKQQ